MRRFLSVSVLAAFVLSLFPVGVSAAPSVFISEVAWAGSSLSTADEWLEIANFSDAPVDLSGWRVEGAASSNGALVIPSGSIVAGGATFLIANYGASDVHSTLGVQASWVTTGVSLPNDYLHLILRDATGALVDEAGVGAAAAPAGSTGTVKASMERVLPDKWKTTTDSIGFDAGATDLGTPGSFVLLPPVIEAGQPEQSATETPQVAVIEEVVPTVDATSTPEMTSDATSTLVTAVTTVTDVEISTAVDVPPPSAVRLSELMPIPLTGEHEWVELTNPSDVGEFLDGWTIEDGKGVVARLSGLLAPWGRIVIEEASSHFNDAGDVAILKRASGEVIDAVSYGVWDGVKGAAPKRGGTVARVELSDEWSITTHPTPGEANIIETEAPPAPKAKKNKTSAPAKASGTTTESADTDAQTPAAKSATRSSSATAVTRAPKIAVAVAPIAASVAAAKTAKAKSVAKPRYKGASFEATVAVPLGVYGKTRMMVEVDGAIRELRFTKAPTEETAAGEHITFIAQEKTDGATSYLYANVKTLALAEDDDADEPAFAPMGFWPSGPEPVELSATVVSAVGGRVVVSASGTQGVVVMPASVKLDLKPGDQVSVRGYTTTAGTEPLLYLAAQDALTVMTHAIDPSAANSKHFPPWAAATLTSAALAVGLLAYLRNERLKRLSLVRREDDLPLEE